MGVMDVVNTDITLLTSKPDRSISGSTLRIVFQTLQHDRAQKAEKIDFGKISQKILIWDSLSTS